MINNTDNKKNFPLWKYAGMATQFLVGLGLGVFIGMKADKWLHFRIPVLVWLLPLLIITGVIIKIVKDTSKSK
jgi:hypothetical protein